MLRQTWQALGLGQPSDQNIAAGQLPITLPTNGQTQAAKVVEEWLLRYFDEQLGINPRVIDPAAPFSCYGLRSIQSMCLVMDLADWLGCALPPTSISDYPSIRALASYAASQTASPLMR